MSSGQSEPKKGDETQDSPVSKEALATLVNLRQTGIDELLLYIERTTSKRSDWLLAIAGGTFAALLSSGLIKPGSVKWETKELLIALSLSSICGVILRVYQRGLTQFVTLTKDDIEKIKETIRKEIGEILKNNGCGTL